MSISAVLSGLAPLVLLGPPTAGTVPPELSRRRRRGRREPVTLHDLKHSHSIRWSAGRRADHLSAFAEVMGTDRRGGDHAKRLRVLVAVVVEAVDCAAR